MVPCVNWKRLAGNSLITSDLLSFTLNKLSSNNAFRLSRLYFCRNNRKKQWKSQNWVFFFVYLFLFSSYLSLLHFPNFQLGSFYSFYLTFLSIPLKLHAFCSSFSIKFSFCWMREKKNWHISVEILWSHIIRFCPFEHWEIENDRKAWHILILFIVTHVIVYVPINLFNCFVKCQSHCFNKTEIEANIWFILLSSFLLHLIFSNDFSVLKFLYLAMCSCWLWR